METGNSHVSGTTFLSITSTDSRDAILFLIHFVFFQFFFFFLNLIQYFSKSSLEGQLIYVFTYECCNHHKPLKFISSVTLDKVVYSSIYSLNQGSYMSGVVSMVKCESNSNDFLAISTKNLVFHFTSFYQQVPHYLCYYKLEDSLFSCLYIAQWLIAFCCPEEIREVILLPTFTIILLTRIGNENFTFI